MKKDEFLLALEEKLSGLPKDDIKASIEYYSEMIDDRIEEGIDEEEAVRELGNVSDITNQILGEIPLSKLVKEKIRRRRALKAWEIVLIILGSPVWLPVLAAVGVVALAVIAVLWSVVITFYSVDVAIGAVALGSIPLGIVSIVIGNVGGGLCWLGASLFCAGVCIFAFFGCDLFAKLVVFISKKSIRGLKTLIIGGERRK